MEELEKYFSGEPDPNIQYASREQGIKAFAETYSFNIESELYNQLTKEQQTLWRKEIEQAVISGGEEGLELARDIRYKENVEVKETDLDKEHICMQHTHVKTDSRYFRKYIKEITMKMIKSFPVDTPTDGTLEDKVIVKFLMRLYKAL